MSYIGSTPTTQSFIAGTDYFNGNGSTVNFTLSRSVNSVNDIEVIVNNVEQIPSGYSVSGTTLTFSAAPSAGTSNVYVRYLSTTNLSLAIPAGTSATFNTVTATSLTATDLTVTNGASIQGLTVGKGAGAVASNTAVGASALNSNTTGSFNIAVGYQAAYSNSTAVGLTAFGANALYATTASDNCAIGTDNPGNYTAALESNTTGRFNTAVATGALGANTTGSNNTGLGHQALTSNTTASNNTAVGYQSLTANTTGSDNAAVGRYSLGANTTGSYNTAIGRLALSENTTASNNTAVGYQAGYTNSTGTGVTALGYQAGYNQTTANRNTLVGIQTGYSLTTGGGNTFIGTPGSANSAGCGYAMTTGANNTIIGGYTGNQGGLDIRTSSNYIVLSDGNGNPRGYFDGSGNLLVGCTTINVAGTSDTSGFVYERADALQVSRNNTVANFNRFSSDGGIIAFNQDGTTEGTVSVSGTTVSYNGGHLSRWAQTTTAKDNTLVKGTVLSNLDAMNVYTKDGQPVENEQLNKVKVSDVEGDANVAGVFVNWDHDEAHNVDEINMAMTGDMIIRIAQGTTVARGDLLMSAGDGTAKPQGDDIVRSKTVAKVTSTHVTCTYADGSYCVPCVLMAC